MLESSIVAAGVPRRRAPWARVAAGATVAAVLFVTASLVSIHLEREPAQRPDLAAGATTDLASAVRTATEPARDEVPAPPEPAPTPLARPQDLPAATPSMQPRVVPQAVTTTASLPPDRRPPAVPELAPSSPPKQVDRSEVF